jgi:hypothetical protein
MYPDVSTHTTQWSGFSKECQTTHFGYFCELHVSEDLSVSMPHDETDSVCNRKKSLTMETNSVCL